MARIIHWDLGENSISLLLLFKRGFGFEMSAGEVYRGGGAGNCVGPSKDGNQRK